MLITKHGNGNKDYSEYASFTCPNCECEFIGKHQNDYDVLNYGTSLMFRTTCPECSYTFSANEQKLTGEEKKILDKHMDTYNKLLKDQRIESVTYNNSDEFTLTFMSPSAMKSYLKEYQNRCANED